MNKQHIAPFPSDGAILLKLEIRPSVQRIMKVDNLAIPEYTIIQGIDMGIDVYELWDRYFPPVTVTTRIGDTSENPFLDNFIAMIKPFIIIRDGVDLLDIKGMAKHPVFSSLFPSKDDPAFKHWPKLEKELEEGKTVEIIEFFIKEEYDGLEAQHKKLRENIKNDLPPIYNNLLDKFIGEIYNGNWIYYDNKDNTFKYKFSNILHIPSSNTNSIYEAIRCYYERYCAWFYAQSMIKYEHNGDKKQKIKNAIKRIDGKKIFIPTRKAFENEIVKLMKFGRGYGKLKRITKKGDNYPIWNEWVHYYNSLRNIFSKLRMKERLNDLENATKKGDGRIDSFVKYLSKIIKDLEFREKNKEIKKGKIDFKKLEAKLNKYYDDYKKEGHKSLNDKVKGKDGEDGDERIDLYDTLDENDELEEDDERIDFHNPLAENKQPFHNISLHFLTDDKLEIWRKKWLGPFKQAFGQDEYTRAHCGQVNFASKEAFRRFFYWLYPHLVLNKSQDNEININDYVQRLRKSNRDGDQENAKKQENRLQKLREWIIQYNDLLPLYSDLFKDYCRVHRLNPCIYCIIPIEENKKNKGKECCPIAHDHSNRFAYDINYINKCIKCCVFEKVIDDEKKEARLKVLKDNFDHFEKRINRFIALIKDDLKEI